MEISIPFFNEIIKKSFNENAKSKLLQSSFFSFLFFWADKKIGRVYVTRQGPTHQKKTFLKKKKLLFYFKAKTKRALRQRNETTKSEPLSQFRIVVVVVWFHFGTYVDDELLHLDDPTPRGPPPHPTPSDTVH